MRIDKVEFSNALSPDPPEFPDPDAIEEMQRNMIVNDTVEQTVMSMILHSCQRKRLVIVDDPMHLKIGFGCAGCLSSWGFGLRRYHESPPEVKRLIENHRSRTVLALLAESCFSLDDWKLKMSDLGGVI